MLTVNVCMEICTFSWQVKSLLSFTHTTPICAQNIGHTSFLCTHTTNTRPLVFLQLKQKLQQSQQRTVLCSRTADEAEGSRRESEKSRALAEARALRCQQDKEAVESEWRSLSEELQLLKQEVQNMESEKSD